jgi:cytidylate kinase
VAVWTISWQEGSGGEEVARLLAERAGVPLVDREVIEAIARTFDTGLREASEIERHLPGALTRMGLSAAAIPGGSALAVAELRKPETLRDVVELVFRQAARWPCVLLGRGGFAILAGHPGAYHVRIRAPFEWRSERYACLHCLAAAQARKALERDDRARATYIRQVHRRQIDDPANFHLLVDASRFSPEAVADLLLLAGGRSSSGADPILVPSESLVGG